MSQDEDYLKSLEAKISETRQRIALQQRLHAQLERRSDAIGKAVARYVDDYERMLATLGWTRATATRNGFDAIDPVLTRVRREAITQSATATASRPGTAPDTISDSAHDAIEANRTPVIDPLSSDQGRGAGQDL
ncbi:MAG: hypothetical protein ACTMHX_04630 [Bifidobacterium mongoliense]|jgi:hypothetical protein